MPAKVDLTGKKFGNIEVINETTERWYGGYIVWKVRCNKCDKIYKSTIASLKTSKSCQSCSNIKHGHGYDTPTYKSYWSMKQKEYYICKRWLNSFENFLKDMGERPSKNHVLSRIDKEKGYSKKNCMWLFLEDHIKTRRILKGKDVYNYNGYTSKNIPLYDTYAHQISYVEQVRRNKDDKNILEVKCAYCGKWYMPTIIEVRCRIDSLNGIRTGENRLYCSNECKKECPIYNQNKYPKSYKKASSREVQPELRQMVFERDGWKCTECDSTKSLHCHHVEGIRYEPLESADIDKCITLCKKCHKKVHKKEGCGYHDFKCKEK